MGNKGSSSWLGGCRDSPPRARGLINVKHTGRPGSQPSKRDHEGWVVTSARCPPKPGPFCPSGCLPSSAGRCASGWRLPPHPAAHRRPALLPRAPPARERPFLPLRCASSVCFLYQQLAAISPTSLGFNRAIPQFSKQISPDKAQTFEANCNLIQLKR